MTNTDKKICRIATDLLLSAGIRRAVVSPGTRNSPMLTALAAGGFELYPVVDERSAAFIALGMSRQLRQPVVLVCTSGTAPLNYAPAVAEAYYSSVPLIVMTADRPAAFIGNQRAQTIDQRGIYRNYIGYECDIDENDPEEESIGKITRAIATGDGPAHINLRLEEPLGGLADIPPEKIHSTPIPAADRRMDDADRAYLADVLATRRTLVIAGPQSDSTEALHIPAGLASRPNIAVLTEATSNLRVAGAITDLPSAVTAALRHPEADALPEYVITCGGTLVSQRALDRLSSVPGLRHISLNATGRPYDPMGCLERAIPFGSGDRPFAEAYAMVAAEKGDTQFSRLWHSASGTAARKAREALDAARWCQWKVMDYIFGHIGDANVHLSNGMTVRLAQSLGWTRAPWLDCNRGVSGIDGSTSTATGEALASPDRAMILLTGDLSFQYDIGALACGFIPDNFKIVVFNNRGGGIFRFIDNTRSMPRRESLLGDIGSLDIARVAAAHGFTYFRASDMEQLAASFSDFTRCPCRAVLEAVTDSDYDNTVFINYLKSIKR